MGLYTGGLIFGMVTESVSKLVGLYMGGLYSRGLYSEVYILAFNRSYDELTNVFDI